MLNDVLFGFRMLRKNVSFTVITVLTLALTIGANTWIFSLVNSLLLKSQPGIVEANRLVDLYRTRRGGTGDTVSYPNYLDYAKQTDIFSGVMAYTGDPIAVSFRDSGPAERLYGTLVTSNYFEVLK